MEPSRVARDLLGAEGMSPHGLRRAVAEGELDRVRRGVYAPHRDLDQRSRHLQLLAATLPLLGVGSVVSHASAAVLHGLP
ncbi:MAG: type IV toxin-antitoxin system AbiEi family antitoxin domain-containing protein, partial [Propionibacteriaceae bacterium]|nr:type IV toxin-antitoxin system AbiEi family antitoxin domain-containing protein [Propionibacteriaceae bacterium]